jgi:hypothetical protein
VYFLIFGKTTEGSPQQTIFRSDGSKAFFNESLACIQLLSSAVLLLKDLKKYFTAVKVKIIESSEFVLK